MDILISVSALVTTHTTVVLGSLCFSYQLATSQIKPTLQYVLDHHILNSIISSREAVIYQEEGVQVATYVGTSQFEIFITFLIIIMCILVDSIE